MRFGNVACPHPAFGARHSVQPTRSMATINQLLISSDRRQALDEVVALQPRHVLVRAVQRRCWVQNNLLHGGSRKPVNPWGNGHCDEECLVATTPYVCTRA